jgi:carbon starvation protein CstA
MVAVDILTTVLPIAMLTVVAVVVVVWLALTRVFTSTRAGRHAAHFLDVGGADMSDEDRIKFKSQHPGAGGYG